MEHLEVRSKSFLIKWINAPDKSSIKWEVKPLKKSVNFGIYRYKSDTTNQDDSANANINTDGSKSRQSNESRNDNSANGSFSALSLDEVNEVSRKRFSSLMGNSNSNTRINTNSSSSNSISTSINTNNNPSPTDSLVPPPSSLPRRRSDSSTSVLSQQTSNNENSSSLEERLDTHLVKEEWIGKCPGDELVTGTFEVEHGGLFAFVFDNTFSRHMGKKIMFNQYIERYDDIDEDETSLSGSNAAAMIQQQSLQLGTIKEDSVSISSSNASVTKGDDPQQLTRLQSLNNNNGSHSSLPQSSSTTLQKNISRKSIDFHNPNNVKFELPEGVNDSASNKASKKRKNNVSASTIVRAKGGQYLQGFLLKRKRRRTGAKNFSKRFFVLNFKYGVLDYYFDSNSNNIRGNMYIKNAVISADSKQLMISLDSGIEQWVLKAFSQQDFRTWVQAFNFIKKHSFVNEPYQVSRPATVASAITASTNVTENESINVARPSIPTPKATSSTSIDNLLSIDSNVASPARSRFTIDGSNQREDTADFEDDDYDESESEYYSLRERSGRTTELDKFKSLEKSITNIKKLSALVLEQLKQSEQQQHQQQQHSSQVSTDSLPVTKRRSSLFWKRGKKNNVTAPTSTAASTTTPSEQASPNISPVLDGTSSITASVSKLDIDFSGHSTNNNVSLMEELNEKIKDLDIEYCLLMNTTTNRGFSRGPPVNSPKRALSRTTTVQTSLFSQDFYDAQEYIDEVNQGVVMVNSDDDEEDNFEDAFSDNNVMYDETHDGKNGNQMDMMLMGDEEYTSSSDEDDEEENYDSPATPADTVHSTPGAEVKEVEQKSKDVGEVDLYPLPLETHVTHRKDIKPSTCDPPSLIGFLRKNIGKDLSTIAMPVSSNEPLTFLQKYAEAFEYANLLNEAIANTADPLEKILKVAVFVVTSLSSYRAKMRNNRKPFNPLLGETFELVRDDLGIRMLVEKVVHRPPVFAAHVESKEWILDQNASPNQKFGGKSMELSVSGLIKLVCRKDGTVYTWHQPITLLKNILAGEKYSEPYSSVVVSSSTGHKAEIVFKSVGMFSGRSETLVIKAFDPKGTVYHRQVLGTWTESLYYSDTNEVVWKAGNLVTDYTKKFGFTEFAASLNEITPIEENHMAPTDSRLRPDQRAFENGLIDEAESLKLKLEQDQRERRKLVSDADHVPSFFRAKTPGVVNGDESWVYIDDEKSYWNRRKRNDWDGLIKLW